MAAPPSDPTRHEPVARIKKRIDQLWPLDDEIQRILIVESIPQSTEYISSGDPNRLWWIDRSRKECRELKGPWTKTAFHLQTVSPDGRFVVLSAPPKPRTDRDRYCWGIYILDRTTGKIVEATIRNRIVEPVRWVGEKADLRIACLNGLPSEDEDPLHWFLVNPITGVCQRAKKPPLPTNDVRQLSPDETRLAVFDDKKRLVITNLATKEERVFTFEKDERRRVINQVRWVSPRYVQLYVGRLALFDTENMTLSYPLPKEDDSRHHRFSPEFNWVLWWKPKVGAFLSPIISPSD
jgi:hypothetical protein